MNALLLTLVALVLVASLSISESHKSISMPSLDSSSFTAYQARMNLLRNAK